MKIGIDARPLISDTPSGIGVYLANIIDYIKQNDKNNNYILYTNSSLSSKYSFSDNITVKVIDGKVGTIWLRYLLPKILKKDGITVFWGTQHILPRKVKGIRYVLTVHDLALLINPNWGSRINSFMQNVFARFSIKDADYIIADSASTKNDIVKICKVDENKISVVYLGAQKYKQKIIEDDDASILAKLKINKKYYLYLGTLEPRKNIDTIVKAFEYIASEDKDAILVLAGGIGWKFQSTLEYIKKSDYKNQIVFTGYVSQIEKAALLKNCICFLFPSHYEGFGIPILEAFASGALVVTSLNSSLPEVGGDAAFYIKNENDARKLSEIMRHVSKLNEPEKSKRLQKGLSQINRFEWSKCSKQTIDVITNEKKE